MLNMLTPHGPVVRTKLSIFLVETDALSTVNAMVRENAQLGDGAMERVDVPKSLTSLHFARSMRPRTDGANSDVPRILIAKAREPAQDGDGVKVNLAADHSTLRKELKKSFKLSWK